MIEVTVSLDGDTPVAVVIEGIGVDQLYPALIDAPTPAAFIAFMQDILARLAVLEAGGGAAVYSPSLDFSDDRNSQFIPLFA